MAQLPSPPPMRPMWHAYINCMCHQAHEAGVSVRRCVIWSNARRAMTCQRTWWCYIRIRAFWMRIAFMSVWIMITSPAWCVLQMPLNPLNTSTQSGFRHSLIISNWQCWIWNLSPGFRRNDKIRVSQFQRTNLAMPDFGFRWVLASTHVSNFLSLSCVQ